MTKWPPFQTHCKASSLEHEESKQVRKYVNSKIYERRQNHKNATESVHLLRAKGSEFELSSNKLTCDILNLTRYGGER